jgi:hypothetical protein
MHKLAIAAALIAVFAAVQGAAEQVLPHEPLRANERYCLESATGGDQGGCSGGSLLCRYETMAQCMASKTTQGDRCMLNPWLAFRQK